MMGVLLRTALLLFVMSFVTIGNGISRQERKSEGVNASREIKRFCGRFGYDKKCNDVSMFQPVVAFTAILSHTINLGEKAAVIYDKVLTNIGHGYNVLTGHFKVPTSGLYSISVSMMAQSSNSIYLNLVRNGIELVRLWTQSGRYELSSHTINVPLKQGDHLWVRRHSGSTLYGRENFNVFSATLLRNGNFE